MKKMVAYLLLISSFITLTGPTPKKRRTPDPEQRKLTKKMNPRGREKTIETMSDGEMRRLLDSIHGKDPQKLTRLERLKRAVEEKNPKRSVRHAQQIINNSKKKTQITAFKWIHKIATKYKTCPDNIAEAQRCIADRIALRVFTKNEVFSLRELV